MGFWNHIDSKTSTTKAHYAFIVAGVITGVVAIVWVSTLPARFARSVPSEDTQEDFADSAGFANFMDNTKDQLGNIIEGVKDINETQNVPTNLNSLDLRPTTGSPTMTSEETPEVMTQQQPLAQDPENEEQQVSSGDANPSLDSNNDSPRVILIATTTSAE